jgi:hypothetical protein
MRTRADRLLAQGIANYRGRWSRIWIKRHLARAGQLSHHRSIRKLDKITLQKSCEYDWTVETAGRQCFAYREGIRDSCLVSGGRARSHRLRTPRGYEKRHILPSSVTKVRQIRGIHEPRPFGKIREPRVTILDLGFLKPHIIRDVLRAEVGRPGNLRKLSQGQFEAGR